MITPFVQLYTNGITDANYFQPMFGYLLIISEALYLVKTPHLDLAYSANKFKEITFPAYIEAFLNIIISVILVKKIGLIGVAIGTIVAMIYRMAFQVYFTTKIIHGRKQFIFYKKLIIFTIFSIISFYICSSLFAFESLSILNWIIHAFIYSFIVGVNLLIPSLLFFKNEILFFIKYTRG